MLRVLPPIFKPVNNLICCKTGLMWVVKRTISLFNSFCSSVARQVARPLLPVFPAYLRSCSSFIVSDRENAKFVPLNLLCPQGVGTTLPGMGEEGEGKGIGICNCGSPRWLTTLEKRSREAWGKKVAHGAQVQVKSGFINKQIAIIKI